MVFLVKQWADGLFINGRTESITPPPLVAGAGAALDRGALAAGLGGAFCPGAEAGWIMRNPAIYSGPYRIHLSRTVTQGELSQPADASLEDGLEPGDLTKYSAVPWQTDFNECTNQPTDVTYRKWNSITPEREGDPVATLTQLTYWWPVPDRFWRGLAGGTRAHATACLNPSRPWRAGAATARTLMSSCSRRAAMPGISTARRSTRPCVRPPKPQAS